MGYLLLLGGVLVSAAGAFLARRHWHSAPCAGAAIGMSLYIGWAAAAFGLAWRGAPTLPVHYFYLALYSLVPVPVVAFGLLGLTRPRHRRRWFSLAGAASLALVLPMMLFSAYWWAGTGLLLLVVGVIPAFVFFYEAYGDRLSGQPSP